MILDIPDMSRLMTKPTKWHVRPAKTQISLGFRPVWSEPFAVCWMGKDPSFLRLDSEDSDQTGWMPRLIWVFARHTITLLGFVMLQLISACNTGLSLGGCLGEKCFLSWLTSLYLKLRDTFKCIVHIGKSKIWTKTFPWNPEIVTKLLTVWKL